MYNFSSIFCTLTNITKLIKIARLIGNYITSFFEINNKGRGGGGGGGGNRKSSKQISV